MTKERLRYSMQVSNKKSNSSAFDVVLKLQCKFIKM